MDRLVSSCYAAAHHRGKWMRGIWLPVDRRFKSRRCRKGVDVLSAGSVSDIIGEV
jgi:hypothetical protein